MKLSLFRIFVLSCNVVIILHNITRLDIIELMHMSAFVSVSSLVKY